MRWTILGLFIVGIIAAGAATMLAVALQQRGGVGAVTDRGSEEIEVLVAKTNLPSYTIIDSDAVARTKAKRSEAEEKKYLTNETQVIGQMLIADVRQGEVFRAKQFPDAESDISIIRALKPGMRAMSILLSSEQGIENILYPGCVVDVVATFRLPPPDGQGFGEIVTATVLRQIDVLGVGPRTVVSENIEKDGKTTTDNKRGRMIALQVTPQQGEMLQMATTQGQVTLALRNPLDKSEDTVGDGTRLGDLSKDLAEKIRRLYEDADRKAQPQQLPVATEVASTTDASTPPTLVVEPRNSRESDQPMWLIQVLRNGRIADTMKFPLTDVHGKK